MLQVDHITAGCETILLDNGDAVAIGPAQGHDKFIFTAQRVSASAAREVSQVIRFRAAAGRTQSRLDESEIRWLWAEELDKCIGLVFGYRIVAQLCFTNSAATRIDLNIEDVRAYPYEAGGGLNRGNFGQLGSRLHYRSINGRLRQSRQLTVLSDRRQGLFTDGRRHSCPWRGPIILHPLLVRKPDQKPEGGPHQQSLIIHLALYCAPAGLVFPVRHFCQCPARLSKSVLLLARLAVDRLMTTTSSPPNASLC